MAELEALAKKNDGIKDTETRASDRQNMVSAVHPIDASVGEIPKPKRRGVKKNVDRQLPNQLRLEDIPSLNHMNNGDSPQKSANGMQDNPVVDATQPEGVEKIEQPNL